MISNINNINNYNINYMMTTTTLTTVDWDNIIIIIITWLRVTTTNNNKNYNSSYKQGLKGTIEGNELITHFKYEKNEGKIKSRKLIIE